MFSALRLRVLELISPSSKKNEKRFPLRSRSRSRPQPASTRVHDGRIAKPVTPEKISSGIRASRPNSWQDTLTAVSGASNDTSTSVPHDAIVDDSQLDHINSEDDDSGTPSETSNDSSTSQNSSPQPTSPERTLPSPPNTKTPSRTRRRIQWKTRKISTKEKPPGHPDRDVVPEELSSPDSPTDYLKNKNRLPMLYKTEEAEHLLDLEVEGSTLRDSLAVENYPLWTAAEIDLFNKLNLRGFEPLLPQTWALDFPTIPSALFTDHTQEAFMNAMYGSEFRAIRTLSVLLELGARVRDCVILNTAPEKLITRYIQQYIKWSYQDGDLITKNPIPILQVITARGDEAVEDVVDRASRELHDLGQLYRRNWPMPKLPKGPQPPMNFAADSIDNSTDNDGEETEEEDELEEQVEMEDKGELEEQEEMEDEEELEEQEKLEEEEELEEQDELDIEEDLEEQEEIEDEGEMEEEEELDESDPPLPTVYGFVIAYTTVSLITYDSNQPEREIKALALFDFMLDDQDVWNAFAIAIIVIWARDYLVSLGWDDVPQIAKNDPDL